MAFDWTPSWSDFTSGLAAIGKDPERALLLVPATYPLFALGAAINEATGGESATYNAWTAAQPGGSAGTTYSDTTQWLSGYSSPTPGGGDWRLPVLNDKLPDAVADLTGIDLNKLLIAAALVGVAVLAD